MSASESFYMRTLPSDLLVSYESTEGKALFKSALEEGGMEAFFPLSQQFLTQNEPAYCGIGTLCMVLNALKIDPEETWRKPWRWFTQEMLDCCRPLEWVKQHGITLAEFSCLAKCNGLNVNTKFADQTSFEQFEKDVKACTHSAGQLMALSYSRASLGQTGMGHFSPAGGYCSRNGGMVLVLDVARFKYPSYWVPIKALFDALIPNDPSTGQPRGYAVLQRPVAPRKRASLLTLNATMATWRSIYDSLAKVAAEATDYANLRSALSDMVEQTNNFLIVTSRLDKGAAPKPPELDLKSNLNFNLAEGAKMLQEYPKSKEQLEQHFAQNSILYQESREQLWTMETTVFILALLSLPDFLVRMNEDLREHVKRHIQQDLRDERIATEVDMVRCQIEGLVMCCQTEACCGGGCRKG